MLYTGTAHHCQVKENTYFHICETSTTNFKSNSEVGTNYPTESRNLNLITLKADAKEECNVLIRAMKWLRKSEANKFL